VRLPQNGVTSSSGRSTGSGRKTMPLSTLRMAVLTPIPRPSVSAATAVKPGRFNSIRTP
jgi:hypothetical protein